MSLAMCDCGALIDTDAEPEAFYNIDENGDEIEIDQPLCSSCRDGTY